MKRAVGADLASGLLNLISGGVVGDALASKYIGGDTKCATQMIRDSGDMEISPDLQELLINEETDENLFQEAAAAAGVDVRCHP